MWGWGSGSIRIRVSRYIGRTLIGGTTRGGARRAVGRVRRGGHSFLGFDEDISNVIGSDVDSVCNPSHAKNTLSR